MQLCVCGEAGIKINSKLCMDEELQSLTYTLWVLIAIEQ